MAASAQNLSVPIAHAGPIADGVLDQIIASGTLLQNNLQPTEADLHLILITCSQIASELLQRRRAMGVIEDMTDLSNVRFLPAS